jgi:hypothetical protein
VIPARVKRRAVNALDEAPRRNPLFGEYDAQDKVNTKPRDGQLEADETSRSITAGGGDTTHQQVIKR